jgi:uncharacterized protein
MVRPLKCRLIAQEPNIDYFKPRGIPLVELEEVNLTLDEFEALRLADLNGLYQEEACQDMKVSRATFGNILNNAHRKIAEAIINGKAIRIEGGVYNMRTRNRFRQRAGRQGSQSQAESNITAVGTVDNGQSKEQGLNQIKGAGRGRGRCRRRGK